jgi:hypothetical protein
LSILKTWLLAIRWPLRTKPFLVAHRICITPYFWGGLFPFPGPDELPGDLLGQFGFFGRGAGGTGCSLVFFGGIFDGFFFSLVIYGSLMR